MSSSLAGAVLVLCLLAPAVEARAADEPDRKPDRKTTLSPEERARIREAKRVRPPKPPSSGSHRHYRMPKTWRWNGRGPRVIVFHPDRPFVPRPAAPERAAAGGIALAAGATSYYGLVPLDGGLMAGARLQVVLAAPSERSRWLSKATFGLTGGIDSGEYRGVDAQVYRAGAVVSLGAPWSRDVFGVSVEGGLLGSRYYDGNANGFQQSTRQITAGPVGESFGPSFYGLGRLTLQAPLKGDVRPFIAGEFGVTERHDDKVSAIAGLTGGIVLNAW